MLISEATCGGAAEATYGAVAEITCGAVATPVVEWWMSAWKTHSWDGCTPGHAYMAECLRMVTKGARRIAMRCCGVWEKYTAHRLTRRTPEEEYSDHFSAARIIAPTSR